MVAVGEEYDSADVECIPECVIRGVGVCAPELRCFMGRHEGAVAFELEVEREEDGLHVWKDLAEYKKPHFYQVRDEAVVRDTAESLFEGYEAGFQ